MYDEAVGLAPLELAPPPAGDEVVALDPPLPAAALFSMNDVVPVAAAPVRAVRDVPLVELDVDVVTPLVPVVPA